MTSRSWIRKLFVRSPRTIRKARVRGRLAVEALEDRMVLSTFDQVIGAVSPFTGINGGGATGPASAPALADVDGDGDLDLVLGDAGRVRYFKHTGTATKPVYTEQTGAANPFASIFLGVNGRPAPTLGDIDGDGDLDLIVGASDGTLHYFLNTGTATNPVYAEQTGAANPFNGIDIGNNAKPALADVDGDGDLDLIVGASDGTLHYFLNTGTATNPVYVEQTGAANPFNAINVGNQAAPTLRDVDGDGHADLVVGAADGTLRYWRNSGTATSPVYAAQTGAANPFNGFDVGSNSTPALGDVDADHDLDLIAGELNSGAVFYFRQDVPTTFAALAHYPTGNESSSVALGDFNGDGKQDLVSANTFSNDVSVLLGDGHGAFQSAVNYPVGIQPSFVAVGDFNGDGKQDLVTANLLSNDVSVLLGDGHGAFQSAVNSAALPAPSFLAVGDFNGDGKLDLAVTTNHNLGAVIVMLGHGDGTFQSGVTDEFNVSRMVSIAVGDFNGDGKQDVAVAGESGVVAVGMGKGDGTFQNMASYPVGGNAESVAIGDFNGDGKLDLAAATSLTNGAIFSNGASELLGNGNGTFQTAVNFSLLTGMGRAAAVTVGDFFNSDGKQDLAVTGQTSGLDVLLGDGHGAFAQTGEFSTGGNGGGAPALGDFNGDGKLDLAAGGSNNVTVNLAGDDFGPSDMGLSNSSIAENQPAGAVVGIVSVENHDQDADRSFTYQLVSVDGATSNLPFAIASFPPSEDGSLEIAAQLETTVSLDYDAKSSYSIRIRATDPAGAFLEKDFTINILDEPPTNVGLSNSSIPENQPAGTIVGAFTPTGADNGDTFTYSLVAGAGSTGNLVFTIDASGNLKTAASFNFEAQSSYSIRVRTTAAGGLFFEKAFTVGVTNVNEAPTDIALSNSSIPENQPAGTTVGTFSSTDPDFGDNFAYSLVAGTGSTDNAAFTIDAGGNLKTAASFDFETQASYSIRVRTTDAGGLSVEKVFTISVTNVNEAPTDIALSNSSVAENLPAGTVVGGFSSTDPDNGDTGTYSLVAGTGSTDNAAFTIDAGGNLKTAASFDFETQASYSIRVRTTDAGGLSVEKVFTISVTNVNEAPTDIALSNSSVAENLPAGTVVGGFSSTDPDNGDTGTYSLVAGTGSTDNAAFTIDAGGNLQTAASFNFEVQSSYSIRVRTTDAGGLWSEKAFTINVTDVNEQPTDIALSNSSIAENQPAGTTVGSFSSTDPDGGDSFSYSLVVGAGSTDNAAFTIDAGGNLQTAASFNFEVQSSYSIRVRTTDAGGLWSEKAFTISVTNVNEQPTDIALSNSSIAENQPAGTIVGSFSSTDPDGGDSFSYSLVVGAGSTDNAAFTIDAGGNLQTAASFNFEVQSSYSIRVRTTDAGGLWSEKAFTISVTNVNEQPTDIAMSNSSIAENQPAGTIVGSFSSTDPDGGDSFSYSLVVGAGSTDNAAFTIDAGGNLQTAASFNFEVQSSYSIRVRTTDAGGLWNEKAFTINVTGTGAIREILVLNPTAPGSLKMSGNSVINESGWPIYVNSNSATAIQLSGHASLTASAIFDVGGFQRIGNAVFHPTPVTGSAAMSDPLVNLQAPSTGSSQGAVSVAGNSSRTIQPGTYTQIAVSGNASLTLTPGVYVVSSGGFTASGNATIMGSGVVIYVAAGIINLNGNSTVLLTPPTSGAYKGVGIFQARSDASTIYLSGNTYLASGLLYAPKAALNMSGNSNISAALIVDQLTLSGNADPSPTPPSRSSSDQYPMPQEILAVIGAAEQNSLSSDFTNASWQSDSKGRLPSAGWAALDQIMAGFIKDESPSLAVEAPKPATRGHAGDLLFAEMENLFTDSDIGVVSNGVFVVSEPS